jgi:hypothetical protein
MTLDPKSELFYRRCRWLKGIRADETQRLWLDLGVLKIPLVVYRPLGPIANLKVIQTSISFLWYVYNVHNKKDEKTGWYKAEQQIRVFHMQI